MKTFKLFSLVGIMLLMICGSAIAQQKTETIPVSGNCGMCKNTIEKAAKSAGAKSVDWDMTTKILSVSYNTTTTSAEKIQRAIAATGYDTRDVRGDDKAYQNLHACCKYDREQGSKAECCDTENCGKPGSACIGKECCKDGKCSHEKIAPSTQHAVYQYKTTKKAGFTCCQNGTCEKKS